MNGGLSSAFPHVSLRMQSRGKQVGWARAEGVLLEMAGECRRVRIGFVVVSCAAGAFGITCPSRGRVVDSGYDCHTGHSHLDLRRANVIDPALRPASCLRPKQSVCHPKSGFVAPSTSYKPVIAREDDADRHTLDWQRDQ